MKSEDILKTAGKTVVGSGAVALGLVGTAAIVSVSPVLAGIAVIGGGGYALGQYMFGESEQQEEEE